MKITTGQAKTLLDVDFANILKKLKAGRDLTASERAVVQARASEVEAAATGPTYAKTVDELAAILGVSRQTINAWRRRPGSPSPNSNGEHEVGPWREFVRKNNLKSEDAADAPASERSALEASKLRRQIEKMDFELAVEKSHYVLKTERDADIRTIVQSLTQTLATLPSQLGSPFGQIGPEIEKHAEEKISEWREKMSKEFSKLSNAPSKKAKS